MSGGLNGSKGGRVLRRRALVCAPAMPEFDRESGSRRIYDLIETLRSAGWVLTFIANSAPQSDRYIKLLRQRGIVVYVAPDEEERRRIIGYGRFDLALLCFWHVAEAYIPGIRELSPSTRILVDSIDLHFVRNARERLRPGPDGEVRLLDNQFGSETTRELNAYAAADGVLTVSSKESGLINDLANDSRLAWPVPDAEDLPVSPLPIEQRKGILFLGNFRHRPNIDAVEYFCGQVLPLIEPRLLAKHPVSIVGNDLNARVLACCAGTANVRPVGWVPSVLPYLNEACVTVIPLLYGAGTKRKLIQALMVGTPTVSTSIGTEGLAITDGEQALVADDPVTFARSVARVLTDATLWQHLAEAGRKHVLIRHGRDAASSRFADAIDGVLTKEPKTVPLAGPSGGYQQLTQRLKSKVAAVLPAGAKVLMVSKGDAALLALPNCQTSHFPQGDDGQYAGYYPADSAAAIAHLKLLCERGAEYLVFPATSLWWLEHYAELARYLESSCRLLVDAKDLCVVYALPGPAGTTHHSAREAINRLDAAPASSGDLFEAIERFRPAVDTGIASFLAQHACGNGKASRGPRVLVVGICLIDKPNTASHVIEAIAESAVCEVTQKWIALGAGEADARLAAVTVRTVTGRIPKFKLLNELLAQEDLCDYDYVVMTDDDVVVPHHLIDHLVRMQSALRFAIAQPARTPNSYTDHPIVTRQLGVLARRTRFVEIGPVVSIHRSAFEFVFPFDEANSMGWGVENVWSFQAEQRGLVMGIIDAVCVDHSLRKPATHYSWDEADRERGNYWKRLKHFTMDECFTVISGIGADGIVHGEPDAGRGRRSLAISVIIPTFNRAELLVIALQSLVAQTLSKDQYEVIVVDDGSSDDTEMTCAGFKGLIDLRYFRIANSGISAAKNFGIFASSAPLLHFFDDDDAADPGMLQAHVEHHRWHPEATTAILGYTTWSHELTVTPVMGYVMDIGQHLFAYQNLTDKQELDYTYFWGGRSSCKRTLLVNHGVFDQNLKSIIEDIELGYRLAKFGLRVIYNRDAISYMVRPITFEAFCRRCERKGHGQLLFSRRYPEQFVQGYCGVSGAAEKWAAARERVDSAARRVREIESLLTLKPDLVRSQPLEQELHELYKWLFEAYRLKGIADGLRQRAGAVTRLSECITESPAGQRRSLTASAMA